MQQKDLSLGVIFDMDGVIIDSNPYHKIAWTNFLNRRGIEVNDSIFKELIFGTTGDEAIVELLKVNYSKTELEELSNEIDSEYRTIIGKSENIEPVNGFLQFIESVSRKKHKIALATSAPPENVDLILNRFRILDYFDLIIDKTKVSSGKPNPEIYLKTVQGLGISKDNCIVFEDSISGVISARNAGLEVIGLTTSHTENELINVGATFCIKDFSEISLGDILEKRDLNSTEACHV